MRKREGGRRGKREEEREEMREEKEKKPASVSVGAGRGGSCRGSRND